MLDYLNDASSPRNAYPAVWGPFALIGEGAGRWNFPLCAAKAGAGIDVAADCRAGSAVAAQMAQESSAR